MTTNCFHVLIIARTFLIWLILALFSQSAAMGADQSVLFRENFDTLALWEPLTFPKVKKHSVYTPVREGDTPVLKAESHASASAIVYRRTFNVYDYPMIRWRWKVTQLSDRGDPREKAGDDYPIRLYVMFQYDPDKATMGERLLYGAAKAIYGKYPPRSSLSYVWTGHAVSERIFPSPYTDKARMIVLEKGNERVGQWVDEAINIPEDYRKAFGKDPPAMAGLAVMSDTDNTGTDAVAYVAYIEVGKK
jgi:hypothetical protein